MDDTTVKVSYNFTDIVRAMTSSCGYLHSYLKLSEVYGKNTMSVDSIQHNLDYISRELSTLRRQLDYLHEELDRMITEPDKVVTEDALPGTAPVLAHIGD